MSSVEGLGKYQGFVSLKFYEGKKAQGVATVVLAIFAGASFLASGKSILSHRVSPTSARLVTAGLVIANLCVNVFFVMHRSRRLPEIEAQQARQLRYLANRLAKQENFIQWKRHFPKESDLELLEPDSLTVLRKSFLMAIHSKEMRADPFFRYLKIEETMGDELREMKETRAFMKSFEKDLPSEGVEAWLEKNHEKLKYATREQATQLQNALGNAVAAKFGGLKKGVSTELEKHKFFETLHSLTNKDDY